MTYLPTCWWIGKPFLFTGGLPNIQTFLRITRGVFHCISMFFRPHPQVGSRWTINLLRNCGTVKLVSSLPSLQSFWFTVHTAHSPACTIVDLRGALHLDLWWSHLLPGLCRDHSAFLFQCFQRGVPGWHGVGGLLWSGCENCPLCFKPHSPAGLGNRVASSTVSHWV